MEPSREIDRLLAIMAALRDPETGCPWDVQQSFRTIAPYTIEEAYEVVDAIGREDVEDLRDELGDLLLQVVFHSRMAEEAGAFDFGDVVEAICRKLVRRHPHVFGDTRSLAPEAVKAMWSEIKAVEKAERRARRGAADDGVLSGVPTALPGLTRAVKLTEKAATVGFDWDDAQQVAAKIREELGEVEAELAGGAAPDRVEDEVGDLLFAVANLARHCRVDPEAAIRRAGAKFERRFGSVEAALEAVGRSPGDASLAEMEELWVRAKLSERA